jgi:hypothetical protein
MKPLLISFVVDLLVGIRSEVLQDGGHMRYAAQLPSHRVR